MIFPHEVGSWFPPAKKEGPFYKVYDEKYNRAIKWLKFSLQDFLRRKIKFREQGLNGKVKVKQLKENWKEINNYEKFLKWVEAERARNVLQCNPN